MNKRRPKYLFTILLILLLFNCSDPKDSSPYNNIKIDSQLLKLYEGHYRITRDYSVTITSGNGFLYYQSTSQDFGDKLLARSQDKFSLGEWGQTFIEFKRDFKKGGFDLFIVNPNRTPRRCPRIKKPVTIELAQVGDFPIELSFQKLSPLRSHKVWQTLESLKREENLYMITYSADYSGFLEKTLDWDYSVTKKTLGGSNFKCSLFSVTSNPRRIIYGRNFDNERCDVLAGFYRPANGYASIVFTRLSDLGFPTGTDLLSLPLEERIGLLAAPCFIADGMNEQGLVIGVASVKKQEVVIDSRKETIFFMRLCRDILDQAANIQEAISMLNKYNIYDEREAGKYSLAHHLLISDATGDAVVLENSGGLMRVIRKKLPWQMAFNSPLYQVGEIQRKIECQRYKILTSLMNENRQSIDWKIGMQFLRRIAIKGSSYLSCWSSVYDIKERTIYIVLHKKYNQILKLKF
jgi:hypothetical protein